MERKFTKLTGSILMLSLLAVGFNAKAQTAFASNEKLKKETKKDSLQSQLKTLHGNLKEEFGAIPSAIFTMMHMLIKEAAEPKQIIQVYLNTEMLSSSVVFI
jgi:hypothetical protein